MIKVRYAVVLFGMGLCSLMGWRLYNYFFDTTQPSINLTGIEIGSYYNGDVQCSIISSKTGELSLVLDGQQLTDKFKISAGQEYPFTIPTRTLVNGKHALQATIIDVTFGKNKSELAREFFVDNIPLQAALTRPDSVYQVLQGRTLHVQFQANKEIEKATVGVLSQEYACYPESKNSLIYEAFIPTSCEEPANEYPIQVSVVDRVGNAVQLNSKLQVVLFPFKKQVLQISEEKIKKEEEAGPDNRRFEETLAVIAQNSRPEKLWKGSFCPPIDVERISCDYGTVRTTKYKGRYAHKAIDVLGAPKTVVWASQSGIVALKERFAVTGNTVAIDHGLGIVSLYCHLDDFANIEVGQFIAQGNPIGTLGKTGFATGYHLHWELRVNNVAVDPMQWTKPTF